MKAVYIASEISRQAHSQYQKREERELHDEALVLDEVRRLRVLHPEMGGKKLYGLLKPACLGRDRFFALLASEGMLVARKRSAMRTTYSVKSWRYANLMENLLITGIDQVWVTDITYFFIGEACFYVVLIMDVYSRKIVGYNVENHMRAESCHAALMQAFKFRGKAHYNETLIHHSDRGGQYVADLYTDALELKGVLISMCLMVYENSHMERLNRTIKSEYLTPYRPKNCKDLKKKLAKTAILYNDQRPHESLGGLSPTEYEKHLLSVNLDHRKPMRLYVDPATMARNKLRNQMTIFD
jgi:transposase InsO family protein